MKAAKRNYVIGMDVGGTKIATAVVAPDGRIVGEPVFILTEAGRSAEAVLSNTLRTVDLALAAGYIRRDQIVGVGVGIPTRVDPKTGGLLPCANLPTMGGFPLRRALEDRLGWPVWMENDAACFILGEWWFGVARGVEHCCGITLGTGMGMGAIVSGQFLRGGSGCAGEIWCSPYREGMVEDVVSGPGVTKAYQALSGLECDASAVADQAEAGDEKARGVWTLFGEALGYALSFVVNVLDPQLVVIGGSLSKAYNLFSDPMCATLFHYTMHSEKVRIVPTQLGNAAGILGAASLVGALP